MSNTILTGEQILKMYDFFKRNNFKFEFALENQSFLQNKITLAPTREKIKFIPTGDCNFKIYSYTLKIFQKNTFGVDRYLYFYDISVDSSFSFVSNRFFPEFENICAEEFIFVVCHLFFCLIAKQANFDYDAFKSMHNIKSYQGSLIFSESCRLFKVFEGFFNELQIAEMLAIKKLRNEYRNFYLNSVNERFY
jgi:hypothetical protein